MKLKNSLTILMVVVSLLGLVSCGTGNSIVRNNKTDITIDEIEWSVDQSIVEGERYVMLSYTNNSDYMITEFGIAFKEKKDVTEDEKESFYSDLKRDFEFDDADIQELKAREISMNVETDRVTAEGASVKNIHCYYYSGYYYVRNLNHYALVEPDIATIKYVKDGQIYTMYYDYGTKKYSSEETTEPAFYWTESNLGEMIPQPSALVVKKDGRDDDTLFSFKVFGVTLSDFNTYVSECKNRGFSVDPGSYEGFYTADNENGYNVYLFFNEDNYSFSGWIESPDN